jgi:Icc-related predicted phosphoesterase
MIIDCISDLHGHYPKLEGGDLLIVAGDLTARDEPEQYLNFTEWLNNQSYKQKIVIAGNHDNCLQSGVTVFHNPSLASQMIPIYGVDVKYLCDSGTEFHYYDERFPEEDEGFLPSGKRTLKIWGSPWTKTFEDMNPNCKAFTFETEEELASKFSLIPDDVDILVTHGPPQGILDQVINGYDREIPPNPYKKSAGSKSLRRIMGRVKPKLWVMGHIHEGYGEFKDKTLSGIEYHFVNASLVNEHYQPVNKPVRVIL